MRDNKKKDKTLVILTGFACDNNCIMCSLSSFKQSKINRTTNELLLEIKKGKREGFERVEFTGGEPGIRKDIFQLINYARFLRYKEIRISTNGRIFYYSNLCRKFVENGLNRINISLHGNTPQLHNAISRTPGAFEQTIQGIRNIQKYPWVNLEINTVVTRINYKNLNEISSFIFNFLDIPKWTILDLIPDGNALSLYDSLSVKLNHLSKALSDICVILPKQSHISFFDFSFCIFPPSIRNLESISLVGAKEREKIEQRGYNPTRIKKINNQYVDKYKIKVAVCKNCKFNLQCGGVWKKYVELYGKREISVLAKKHQCLKT